MQHLLRLAAAFSLALSALALSEKELKANFEFDFDTFDFKEAYYFDSKGESREQKLLVTKIDGSRYKVPELDAHALPSLFLFPRYDKRHALRYEGDLSYDSIVKWVEAHRPGGHVHDEL